MIQNYPKAYKEVLEVFKYIPKEYIDKVPQEQIQIFETKKDDNYSFFIDVTKDFEEQQLLEETKAILINLFKEYWATPRQKEIIYNMESKQREELEEQKRQRYNPDDLFKNRKTNSQVSSNAMIEVKEESLYTKFINFIKKVFNFNKGGN